MSVRSDPLLLNMETNPVKILFQKSLQYEKELNSKEFAKCMDEEDQCRGLRDRFCIPSCESISQGKKFDVQNDPDQRKDCIYLCGHSLGLMSTGVKSQVDTQIQKWSDLAVYGHFEGELPWGNCETYVQKDMAKLVGAKTDEVLMMNSLTVNLHLLLIAFYKPQGKRRKILFEAKAFPSDHYAFESQIRLHGMDPKECLLIMEPREGEETLRSEDILELIRKEGDEIAIICFPGVQFYTGQLFDIATITEEGHKAGCVVGWDLAHAVGNVELHLHDWGVDFACWCSYKYLNSGAGGIGGIFVHEERDVCCLSRLEGWWTHDLQTRFNMSNEMRSRKGASSFAISNTSMFLIASLRGSLDVFMEAGGMKPLREKSKLLTTYLELLINTNLNDNLSSNTACTIVTPSSWENRGCQLSLRFNESIEHLPEELRRNGVVVDDRKPNVIRVAPVPLYNTFHDVYEFVRILKEILHSGE